MSLRLIKLPADFMALSEVVTESFQYPENEDWSLQTDEKDELVAAMRNLRRIWPLIRLIQAVSPTLRDLVRGYVWEEDGRMVGTTIVQRRGATDVWIVGTVGVLPVYRRRGIARKLVQAALDLIRAHGGTKAILTVIDGNLPAYALYQKLGFEHFSGSIEFEATLEKAPPALALPAGYVQAPLGRFDWQPRYQLEQRITPQGIRQYEPVAEGRFRYPVMTRLLLPLIMFAQSTREEEIAIRTAAEGQIVARGEYGVPTRGKGVNRLWARLDPAHPELAPYLVNVLLRQVMTLSPGRRIEFSVPQWMEALRAAAQAAGLRPRLKHCRMGLLL
jgi:ribosomal protein S18 acetylase RimI-like enzyme